MGSLHMSDFSAETFSTTPRWEFFGIWLLHHYWFCASSSISMNEAVVMTGIPFLHVRMIIFDTFAKQQAGRRPSDLFHLRFSTLLHGTHTRGSSAREVILQFFWLGCTFYSGDFWVTHCVKNIKQFWVACMQLWATQGISSGHPTAMDFGCTSIVRLNFLMTCTSLPRTTTPVLSWHCTRWNTLDLAWKASFTWYCMQNWRY